MSAPPLSQAPVTGTWVEKNTSPVTGLEDDIESAERLTTRKASEIKPRPVRWLLDNRIPLRNITLEAGRAGIGKSTFDAWLVAQVTRGKLDGHYREPKNVIVVATEDDWESTVVPRLIAAGADLDRVLQVEAIETPGAGYTLSLMRDIGELERIVRENEVALIVFDPMVSVAAGAKWNSAEEIRPLLERLREDVLGPLDCAAVGLIHFRKAQSADVLDMITGSGAWTQVARAVIAFAVDEDLTEASGTRTVVVSQVKNNLGPSDLPSQTFTFEPVEIPTDEGPCWAARIVWGEDSMWSAEEILMGRKTDAAAEKTISAEDWLRGVLADGARLRNGIKTIFEAEQETGLVKFSWRSVERAARTVVVRSRDGRGGPAIWALGAEALDAWRDGELASTGKTGEYSGATDEYSPTAGEERSTRQNMPNKMLPGQGLDGLSTRQPVEYSPTRQPSFRRTVLIRGE